MDSNEPTAWEDINPPTALAQQRERRVTCSGLESATSEQFAAELTACLALVAPVGMTEESRREWLSVAWETLKHLPDDLLARGCRVARETCDHPSKIVPTIIANTQDSLELRRATANLPNIQPAKMIETDVDDRPVTLDELLKMSRDLVRMARRNGFADAETFAEYDRIMDERAEENRRAAGAAQ